MPKKYLPIFNQASGDKPHEILVHGPIGRSFWSDEGITGLEFTDALNQIPVGEKVVVGVNSQGGYIGEGLAIFNAIARRAADVTVRIDGYALSIASFFPLAAGKIISPKTSVWMIHYGWSGTQGNAKDHRKSADMLDKHDNVLVSEYTRKTGKSEAEFRALLEAETWMTGAEAIALGLADEESDNEPDLEALDFSGIESQAFKYVPANCQRIAAAATAKGLKLSAPPQGAANPPPNPAPAPAGQRQEHNMKDKIVALLKKHGIKDSTGQEITLETSDAEFDLAIAQLSKKQDLTADARFEAIEARFQLAEERRITDKVLTYVDAGKITNDDVEVWTAAALKNEKATFEKLEKKESQGGTGFAISTGGMIEVLDAPPEAGTPEGLTGLRGPQSEMVANIRKEHKTPKARHAALKSVYDQALRQAITKDIKAGRGREVFASNTYSGTLVTSFLMDGSLTDLVNVWAALAAFSRDSTVDPYKPLATGVLKHVTVAETTQTDATNFEPADGSTVAPISVTMHQYTQTARVSNSDLNSGLRMEDLRIKNVAAFADKVIQVATAPIVSGTFTATPLIISPAAFGWSSMATLRGQLKKSPIKNAILDGDLLARLENIPTFFQDSGVGSGQRRTFGWDLIAENTNWSGAGANINGFACNPQALVGITGLPLTPPNIPGGILTMTTMEVPGLNVAIALFMWFNPSSRTMFVSWDIVAGFTAGDTSAGIIIASGNPG